MGNQENQQYGQNAGSCVVHFAVIPIYGLL